MNRWLFGVVTLLGLMVPTGWASAHDFGPIVIGPSCGRPVVRVCSRCGCYPCCCHRFDCAPYGYYYPYGSRFPYTTRYGSSFYFGTFGPRGGFFIGF
jgi:hypothetical protein